MEDGRKKEPEISGIVDAGKTKIIKKSPDKKSGDFFYALKKAIKPGSVG